jgi:A/G-specific adenine glycosylase
MTVSPAPVAQLQAAALAWYAANGRDLAFRRSTDPWAVLVSEVMAQQTQAARAAAAWAPFIDCYPTPAALATAPLPEVIRAWRGLGYNRRAVALRAAAIRIVEDHGGRVPDSAASLEALPGIGPYTARAVLAIAFGRGVAALDTNIQRVLDRSTGGLPTAPRLRQSAADAFVPPGSAAAWTHALMDIGATFCRKRDPRCAECPLASGCVSHQAGALHRPATTAPSTRKPAPRFEATTRWLRGRILDRMRDAPDGGWLAFASAIGVHDAAAVDGALAALEVEGLIELSQTSARTARLASG